MMLLRHSPRVWIGRLGLAAVALALGGYATLSSYALSARGHQPAAAFAAMPSDARIKAALAEQWSGPDGTPTTRRDADSMARAALARDPLNVSAVATLGINAQVRGDTAAARRAFAYATLLSRRDYRTQLWAIEDAVERGSFVDALHHYDIALRTQRTAPTLLFPVLAQAIEVSEVRDSAIALLMQRPPWGDSFLGYLSGSASPAAAGGTIRALLARGYRVPATATDNMIGSLVRATDMSRAWQVYTAIHRDASRVASRAPDFAQPETAASAFDWNPINDGAVSASIDDDGGRHALTFAISSGGGGIVAQQLQYLPSGQYVLTGETANIHQPAGSRPYWTLACLNGRELGRVEITADGDTGQFSGVFIVPAECSGVWLRLVARPSDAMEGVTGSIVTARLQRTG